MTHDQELIAILETEVACLVQELIWANQRLGELHEARIELVDIDDPPEIETETDHFSGAWIYRLKKRES